MTSHDDIHARRDRDLLIRTLQGLGAKFRGASCNCPFHQDGSASAQIYERDGIWRFRCHAAACAVGGDLFDIRARASGRTIAEEIKEWRSENQTTQPPRQTPKPQSTQPPQADGFPSVESYIDYMRNKHRLHHICTYTYKDHTGAERLLVLKFEDENQKKTFRQAHHHNGRLIPKSPPAPLPLYNLKNILNAPTILVVEGEKCVHIAHQAGIPCTTSAMGAGAEKAALTDWTPLAGKNIVLWPDNDDPDPKHHIRAGIEHMNAIASILERITPPPNVHIIDVDNLELPRKEGKGSGADLEEYLRAIPAELQRQAIIDAMGDAKICGPAAEVKNRLEARIAGRYIGIQWPLYQFSNLTNALLPGTVTLCCGDPGCSKSFFVLQAAAYWQTQHNIPVAIYELEDDRTFHLERALVQACHEPRIFDASWCTANAPMARMHFDRYAPFINDFGRAIWEAPDAQVTLPHLADWVEARCEEGRQIIIIDPITAADSGQSPWISEKEFMFRVKAAIRRYGARLILVTHPKAGGKGIKTGLDQIAGSENYRRFAHTIFWIKHHPHLQEVTVACSHGDFTAEVNREFHIGKARLGKGQGLTIGAIFETQNMSFKEVGLLRHKSAPSRRPETKEEPRTITPFGAKDPEPQHEPEQEALW